MKIKWYNTNLNKKINTLLMCCIIITVSLITGGFSIKQDKSCEATIRHSKDGEMHKFAGIFINKTETPIDAHYTMDATREGASGRSVSSQSGSFRVKENQQKDLSTTSINIQEGDIWKVVLKIYKDEIKICGDSIVVE